MIKKNDFYVYIPAKKNSSALKNKNFKIINGKKLIEYTLDFALDSLKKNIIKGIVLDSDSREILDLAKNKNIFSYKRPSHLAKKSTLMSEVIFNFFTSSQSNNLLMNNIILLQPTSPYRKISDLKSCIKLYSNYSHRNKILISAIKSNSDYFKFFINKNGSYIPAINKKYLFQNRQSFPMSFKPNGSFYIFRKKDFISKKNFPTNKFIIYPMKKKDSYDIDTINDFKNFRNFLT